METIWSKSKWTKADLDHQKVEFRVRTDRGIETGVGEFWVRQNPQGLLAIEIVVETQGRDWAERVQTRYYPKETGVARIVQHPDPKIAAFRLFDNSQ